jgi:hypothetical protein
VSLARRLVYEDLVPLRQRSPRLYGAVAILRGALALPILRRRRPGIVSALRTARLPAQARAELATAFLRQPPAGAARGVSADVLFASVASPDLVKHALGIRRARPELRLALVCHNAHHVEALVGRVFDEVVEVESSGELIDVLERSEGAALALRTRAPTELFWAAMRWPTRLVYMPPGFFLESIPDPPPAPEQSVSYPERQTLERLLLSRADAVVHFLSDGAIEEMRRRGVPVPRDTRLVYAGITPELDPVRRLARLSAGDGEIHVVHATGVAPPGADPGAARFAMHHLKWPTVLEQGIHIHAYFSHIDYDDSKWDVYRELAERYPNFHLERQLPFDGLLEALTQYDWALKHWDMRGRRVIPEHMDHLTTNFFAYLQARLPMIVSPTMALEAREVARLGIGVVVEEDGLPHLGERLRAADRPAIDAAIERAREAYRYDDAAITAAVLGDRSGA